MSHHSVSFDIESWLVGESLSMERAAEPTPQRTLRSVGELLLLALVAACLATGCCLEFGRVNGRRVVRPCESRQPERTWRSSPEPELSHGSGTSVWDKILHRISRAPEAPHTEPLGCLRPLELEDESQMPPRDEPLQAKKDETLEVETDTEPAKDDRIQKEWPGSGLNAFISVYGFWPACRDTDRSPRCLSVR